MAITWAPGRRGWAVTAMSAVLLVAGPVPLAAAHDELTGTEPADGTTVGAAPTQVRMEFSGEIASVGSFVTVTGPLGTVTDGTPQIEGTDVVQPLVADTPPGEYAVVWRVTSQDGHPISGEFDYTVPSAGSATQGPEIAATTDAPERAANTAASPAQGDSSAGSGPSLWVWGVIAVALVALGGLGTAALRRR